LFATPKTQTYQRLDWHKNSNRRPLPPPPVPKHNKKVFDRLFATRKPPHDIHQRLDCQLYRGHPGTASRRLAGPANPSCFTAPIPPFPRLREGARLGVRSACAAAAATTSAAASPRRISRLSLCEQPAPAQPTPRSPLRQIRNLRSQGGRRQPPPNWRVY
jgi:hypothetical protein